MVAGPDSAVQQRDKNRTTLKPKHIKDMIMTQKKTMICRLDFK